MKATIDLNGKLWRLDFDEPLDISMPLRGNTDNVRAWGLEHPVIAPHVDGDFIGKVSEGAAVNFNDIAFNPHAHGTHTECVGHITEESHSVNLSLDRYFFFAQLISVTPELRDDNRVISRPILEAAILDPSTGASGKRSAGSSAAESTGSPVSQSIQTSKKKLLKTATALVIRTLPNNRKKLSRQYSGTNPPYLTEKAARFLVEIGVEHLLIDLPSVDKEQDEGRLLAHKAFWNFDGQWRQKATITELIYVPENVEDGLYLLNLQVAAFENDASPSRPVLYKIED